MLHNIYEQILKVTVTCDFLGNRLPIGIFIETLSNEIGTYLFDFHSGKKKEAGGRASIVVSCSFFV